jgi:hypothetical protein
MSTRFMREQAPANQRPGFGAALSDCNVGRDDLLQAWMAAFHPTAPLVRRHGMASLGSTRCRSGHQCRADNKSP